MGLFNTRMQTTQKLLTKRNLRKLYNCFIKLPPFSEYSMPVAHRVRFEVINDNEVFGWFEPAPPVIKIDEVMNKTSHEIFQTLLHEMIHLYLWYNNHKDYDKHDKKFNLIAKKVCKIYNYSLKEF